MRTSRTGVGARAAGVLVVAVGLVLGLLGPAVRPARAQDGGLQISGTVAYRLEPGADRVHVTLELQLVNPLPSRRRGAYIETPYFDSFAVPAAGPVTAASARSDAGGTLAVSVEDQEVVDLVRVDLEPDLVHGAPQSVTVEYDLPGQPRRSDALTRVNEAFASWLLVGGGDVADLEVLVDVPRPFRLSLGTASAPQATVSDGRRVYRLGSATRTPGGAMVAVARRDDRLVKSTTMVLGSSVTLRSWPGDREWADFARATVEEGLPALQEMLGLPAPDRDLTVLEASGGLENGYAGFYEPRSGRIEVGDALDRDVMLHELAHIWANQQLFSDPWITEGLAEEYASRALAGFDEEPTSPGPIDASQPGAIRLNAWTGAGGVAEVDRIAQDEFAYNAAHVVVRRLLSEIGAEAMRDVLAAAQDGQIAYRAADGAPERLAASVDWRTFYDLLELVGGSEEVRELFTAHVLTDTQQAELDRRDRLRAGLDELADAGGELHPPFAVRAEMARWDFAEARDGIDRAHELLDRIQDLDTVVAEVDVASPEAIATAYEDSDDLDDLDEQVGEYEAAAASLVDLLEQYEQVDPIRRLGLVGQPGPEGATAAFRSGDLDRLDASLAQADRAMAQARLRGAALLAVLVLLAVAALLLVRRWRGGTR